MELWLNGDLVKWLCHSLQKKFSNALCQQICKQHNHCQLPGPHTWFGRIFSPSLSSQRHLVVSLYRYWHWVGLFMLTHFWRVTHDDGWRAPSHIRTFAISPTLPISSCGPLWCLTWWVSLFKPQPIPFSALTSFTNNTRCQIHSVISTYLQPPMTISTPHLKWQFRNVCYVRRDDFWSIP